MTRALDLIQESGHARLAYPTVYLATNEVEEATGVTKQ